MRVYGTARSNILAQDPLPNLNKVYSILIQEETVNMMMRGKDERPELMKIDLKLMGIQNGGEIDCVLIQKRMMLEEDCCLDAREVETIEETLLQMLNGSGSETMNGKFSWIIDSGASHHMTGLIEKLTNIKEIVEWPIELPDGRMVMANKEGNILFNNREKPLVQALNTSASIFVDLWHKRWIGHPSLEVINFLPGVSSSRKDRVISENYEEALGRLRDFVVTHTIRKASPFPASSSAQSWSSDTPYLIAHYVKCDKFSMCHRTFLEAIDADREPVAYSQAVKDKHWCDAMDNELQALETNGTLTIENLPKDKKTLGCKWVYKMKRKSDRTVERFKTRLVIR
ncbi:retrovirus-related pol polyprotein from transposon TNT 1-94 [Tanacetum coccineum]